VPCVPAAADPPPAAGDRSLTIVSFHAHPDDEALLTAGTLARAAAAGHRVVLVCATAGEAGLAAADFGTGRSLGSHRVAELDASAAAIGAVEVELLGYADSGLHGEAEPVGDRQRFADADVETAAVRLAQICRRWQADVLTGYDPQGGYGHPDHVQVHRVARRAAELCDVVLLEATVPREPLMRLLRLGRLLRLLPAEVDLGGYEQAYTPTAALTHRIDVSAHLAAKRAAMQAHASQASADGGARTLAVLLRLPGPLYRLALGREWFVQPGLTPENPLLDDVFATVRSSS
jgi:LmbE family N-acetylglucosaminyl deacetylase